GRGNAPPSALALITSERQRSDPMGDGGAAPSFEEDVRPLFREKDRQRMEWAFDLWRYEDVKQNAEAILERVQDGDMPCDEEWPAEQIATFRSWLETGMAP